MSVIVETTIGDFTIDLYTDERPRSCLNFLKLCKQKYYNFNLMYSIERNFVAQTGDPTGSGRGGSSIFSAMFGEQARLFEGEKLPIMTHTSLGTVSMVAYGDNMYGSQFFVTLGDHLDSLDGEHLVIGRVIEGLDVIAQFNDVLTDGKHRPFQDIRITHTVVLDDPYPDPEELQFPDESPKPTAEVLASDYIAVDESVDDTKGKDITEIHEEIAAKEAEARATILEMVGDLPASDMAPPENVLFVCKLNPVTTSEDLEIIFSRFGKIVCGEVIKDRLTGNSLQYAFIEFDNKKSCEDAYFKMDNVLIDERRIHVDFSQSVSKIQWRGKGRGVHLLDDSGKRMPDVKGKSGKPDSKDGPPKRVEGKNRFIDTEAYGRRFKERQETNNDRRKNYSNESRESRDDERLRNVNERRVDNGRNNRYLEERRRDDRQHEHRDNRRHDSIREERDWRNDGDHRQVDVRRNFDANDRRNFDGDDRRNFDRDYRRNIDRDDRPSEDTKRGENRTSRREDDRQRNRDDGRVERRDGFEGLAKPNESKKNVDKKRNTGDEERQDFDKGRESSGEETRTTKGTKRQKLLDQLRSDLKRKKNDSTSDGSSGSSSEKEVELNKKKKKHKKNKSYSSDSDSDDHVKNKSKKKKNKKSKKSKKSKH